MRRMPPPLAAVLALVLAAVALTAACGGGGDGTASGTTGAAATTTAATAATAPADGTCTDRAPEPAPEPQSYPAPPEQTIDPARTYTATLATSCGDIVIALDAAAAPMTVNNFVFLARQGFYDGLTFHRVVTGFVIQGGDPTGTGSGGPGYAFDDELPDDGYPTGSVAMANSGPNTNGSQFFIVTGDGSLLPNDYSRFGRVTAGLDVAQRIEGFADPDADPSDPAGQKPSQPIYIYAVTITEA
jgi:cyclophilin family peptidyl-prolyl cis-trans isomerase